MDSTIRIEPPPSLIDEPAHGPYTDALRRYLIERGHAAHTVRAYLGCAAHFLREASATFRLSALLQSNGT